MALLFAQVNQTIWLLFMTLFQANRVRGLYEDIAMFPDTLPEIPIICLGRNACGRPSLQLNEWDFLTFAVAAKPYIPYWLVRYAFFSHGVGDIRAAFFAARNCGTPGNPRQPSVAAVWPIASKLADPGIHTVNVHKEHDITPH